MYRVDIRASGGEQKRRRVALLTLKKYKATVYLANAKAKSDGSLGGREMQKLINSIRSDAE